MQSWEKERQISKESPSSPILPNRNVPPQSSPHDLMAKSNFPPDFKKKYEQWQKIKDEPAGGTNSAPINQPNVSSSIVGKIPHNSATSPASEKKIRARPLAQPTIQGKYLLLIRVLFKFLLTVILNLFCQVIFR